MTDPLKSPTASEERRVGAIIASVDGLRNRIDSLQLDMREVKAELRVLNEATVRKVGDMDVQVAMMRTRVDAQAGDIARLESGHEQNLVEIAAIKPMLGELQQIKMMFVAAIVGALASAGLAVYALLGKP